MPVGLVSVPALVRDPGQVIVAVGIARLMFQGLGKSVGRASPILEGDSREAPVFPDFAIITGVRGQLRDGGGEARDIPLSQQDRQPITPNAEVGRLRFQAGQNVPGRKGVSPRACSAQARARLASQSSGVVSMNRRNVAAASAGAS